MKERTIAVELTRGELMVLIEDSRILFSDPDRMTVAPKLTKSLQTLVEQIKLDISAAAPKPRENQDD